MKKFRVTNRMRENLEGLGLMLPWLIGTVLFFSLPMVQSVYLSFGKLSKLSEMQARFVGLEHYKRAIFFDLDIVPTILTIATYMAMNLPMILVFSLFAAMMLNAEIRMRGVWRAIFIIPVILGTGYVMSQLLGQTVISNTEGASADLPANQVITRGMAISEDILVYLGPTFTKYLTVFLNMLTSTLWKSGVQIVLFLGGLQSISRSLYESAHCDGATGWESFWFITFPMLVPVILLNVIYTIVDWFMDASNGMVQYIMSLTFKKTQMEYASAVSCIYLIVVLFIVGAIYFVFWAAQRSLNN